MAVIVPVYKNLEVTRNCLESLLSSELPSNVSVTIIDDASPEHGLSAYCQDLAENTAFELVVNEENQGFVASANKGFTLAPDADIVLLNSDTVVTRHWIQRLQACAYREQAIGTVTPFSNNGTICSYPVFPISNDLPQQWDTVGLDRIFQQANAGAYCEIPTAVGFCMYIKRACLEDTGPFDEDNFGQGYGEECDFSIRAAERDWKHVIAADVFVYHEGAASFADESSDRKSRADMVMAELHPHYHALISEFVERDPLCDFRSAADAARLAENPADAVAVLEEHAKYNQLLRERAEDNRRAMLSEQEQRQQLEQLLSECRAQFAETDSTLVEARAVIDQLKDYLDESRLYSKQLTEHIRGMENSRSWRYTAWMRKES